MKNIILLQLICVLTYINSKAQTVTKLNSFYAKGVVIFYNNKSNVYFNDINEAPIIYNSKEIKKKIKKSLPFIEVSTVMYWMSKDSMLNDYCQKFIPINSLMVTRLKPISERIKIIEFNEKIFQIEYIENGVLKIAYSFEFCR